MEYVVTVVLTQVGKVTVRADSPEEAAWAAENDPLGNWEIVETTTEALEVHSIDGDLLLDSE